MRFEVTCIEGDGRSPFPLWAVVDNTTQDHVQDGVYATEDSAHRRAERENQSVTPAA